MILKNSNILILAPHTDDGELGCGGVINKAVNEGANVHYAAFSTAEASIPPGFSKKSTEQEVKSATKALGIKTENLKIFKYEVRKFNYARQEILEDMIKLREAIDPDIVFLPASDDCHQDHQVINAEGIRSFKKNTILGYELPWNSNCFKNTVYFSLSKNNIKAKINSLKKYKSQASKTYFSPAFIEGLAKVRGVQIDQDFAEAFEAIRFIIK